MTIRGATVAIAVLGFAGTADAAGPYPYGPPASGSPLYSTNSISGDMTAAVGAEGGDDDFTFFEVAGRVNIPLQNGWNFEPDVYYGADSDSDNYFGAVGHFYKRMADNAVGGEGTLALTRRFEGTQVSGFVAANAGSDDGFEWYEARAGLTWNFDPPGTTQYEHDMMVPFTQNSL